MPGYSLPGFIMICSVLLAGLSPLPAFAVLESATDVNFGANSLTRDTATGLDWLDVTHSTGRKYTDISGKFGAGQEFEGYRFATISEVIALVNDNTGFTPPAAASGFGVSDTSGGDVLSVVVAFVGPTLTNATSTRVFGMTRTLGTGNSRVLGLINNFSGADRVSNGPDLQLSETPDEWTGSYLVTDSPSSVPLFGPLGIALLCGLLASAGWRTLRT